MLEKMRLLISEKTYSVFVNWQNAGFSGQLSQCQLSPNKGPLPPEADYLQVKQVSIQNTARQIMNNAGHFPPPKIMKFTENKQSFPIKVCNKI